MNKQVNKKIFLDAVHGYIYIPPEYTYNIIDTPNFQRLKRLEQTNIRPLCPCAHHDRFIHSLGTYHLGSIAFDSIKSNSEEELKVYNIQWDEAKLHFELACLLHDVGHAPFSHTCEKYYEVNDNLDNYFKTKLEPIIDLKNEYNLFLEDYDKLDPKPKEHEKTSAILVLTVYYRILKDKFKLDPFRIARMILGCKYQDVSAKDPKFYNCLIELLNSDTIDVDKLDYLARDQWASGYISKNIDYDRLLSSIYVKEIDDDELVVCYHKRAISELYAIVEVKNIISVRLHSHHIAKYDMFVLREAIEETAQQLSEKNTTSEKVPETLTAKAIHKIISIEALLGTVDFNGIKIKYPIDDDLIFILKSNIDKSKFAQEWFYRDYRLRPVWKTYADYRYYFNEILIGPDGNEDLKLAYQLYGDKAQIVQSFLEEEGFEKTEYYINDEVSAEYNPIYYDNINIFIKDKVVKFRDIKIKSSDEIIPKYYFLLFLPKEIIETDKRGKFIKYVLKQLRK